MKEEIPPSVRRGGPTHWGFTDWSIAAADNSSKIEALEQRIRMRFPDCFKELLCHYSFPRVECGPVFLFANTGQETRDDLSVRLFTDPALSATLLDAGYIQIGNPPDVNYDPICFAREGSTSDRRLVRMDHESILQRRTIEIIEEIAPSFRSLIESALPKP